MIRTILFFVLTLAALAWIGIAGMNLVNFSEKSNPEKLFGAEDGRIFILNRPQEIQMEETNFELQSRLLELYGLLSSSMQPNERLFVSEKKAHILLQASQLLGEKEIMSRFNQTVIKRLGSKKYLWKNFNITFHKGIIDCQITSEKINFNDIKWDSFDKKSSCSIIEFDQKTAVINDYYQHKGITSIYTRKPLFGQEQISCDDRSLFSSYIPAGLSDYQFTEKTYLADSDPIFKESKAFEWTKTGVVAFEYNTAHFLLMDLFDSQEPEQLLEMYRDSADKNFAHYTDIQLTENFPTNKKRGFYVTQIDNCLLISETSSTLSEAEVALDLNQSLAGNKQKSQIIFAQTPKMVNARTWSPERKFARSSYQGISIATEVKSTKNIQQKVTTEMAVDNYAMKSPIEDFIVHDQRDLIFAKSQDNSIAGFKDGKNFLYQTIGEELIGALNWSSAEQNKVVFTSRNKLYAIDENGQSVIGFPVEIPGGVNKGVACFNWKNRDNYLIANLDGKYFWLNEKGEIIKTGITNTTDISDIPKVWVSARRLFFGFRNDTEFSMLEAEKGVQLRTFSIPKNAVATQTSNELTFYGIEGQNLVKIDQKGGKTIQANLATPIWIKSISKEKNDGFCVKNGNTIAYYNTQGIEQMKVKVLVENIDYIHFDHSIKKGMILGVVDGLTNQLKLFQPNGIELTLQKNKAQKKYCISHQNNQFNIYTLVDKFVLHYVL
ncbi:MAG: hypothetical protein WC044_04595 [Crocinitomicaceae bacterium]